MKTPLLTLDTLVAVVALVEHRSYALAGAELAISASAVHKRVRAAETILGQRLFLGTDEGLQLTKEGTVFHADAVRTVDQALLAEERIKAFADLDARLLRVGHSTYLPPQLLGFVMRLDQELSGTQRIQHYPGLMGPLAKRVIEGSLHAAFGDVGIEHPALSVRKLAEEPVVVCLPKGHPLEVKPHIRLHDLDNEPMIAVSREHIPSQHEEIEEYFALAGIRLNIATDAFSPTEAMHMVEQHFGVCLLAASVAKASRVISRPLSTNTLTRRFGVYFREDSEHPAVKDFIDLVVTRAIKRPNLHRYGPSPAGRQLQARSAS